ncbi:hypothetical protein GCM10010994_30860 [Chelatococcus reniformis]|uniref:Uncharacterized protein n=1 Tax=Chelatococcus reniformis TaxID=1494448 RepID=A0A916UDZ0_9HYPH|nr:hypothetical protein GCM10010994_30860 [Chelatococcus reniformis]
MAKPKKPDAAAEAPKLALIVAPRSPRPAPIPAQDRPTAEPVGDGGSAEPDMPTSSTERPARGFKGGLTPLPRRPLYR